MVPSYEFTKRGGWSPESLESPDMFRHEDVEGETGHKGQKGLNHREEEDKSSKSSGSFKYQDKWDLVNLTDSFINNKLNSVSVSKGGLGYSESD